MEWSVEIDKVSQYLQQNWWQLLLYIVAVNILVTILTFAIIVFLPHDYFDSQQSRSHPIVRIIRDVLGFVMILAGVVMIAIPGPGMLTICSGLIVLDGEEKKKLLRKILMRGNLMDLVHRVRERTGRQRLEIEAKENSK